MPINVGTYSSNKVSFGRADKVLSGRHQEVHWGAGIVGIALYICPKASSFRTPHKPVATNSTPRTAKRRAFDNISMTLSSQKRSKMHADDELAHAHSKEAKDNPILFCYDSSQ